MRIYLLGMGEGGDASEQRIRAAVPDVVRPANVSDIAADLAKNPTEQAYVVIAANTHDKQRFENLIELISQHRARMFFILVSEEISASEYKALVRTGNADWVSSDADPKEILDIIARKQVEGDVDRGSTGGGERRAGVISFVPSAGGVGTATLATEIGVYLKTSKPSRDRSVCVVDLDFQSSHVCDHLDIEPRLQIAEISSNPERLDTQLIDIFVSRHSSGLHVFAAPRSRFDVCNLNVAALDAFFGLVSARYHLILIDLPVTWFGWTSQIIAVSDGVLVTGLNTVPGLRQTVEMLSCVREIARGEVAAVVNRCERRLFGNIARRHHIEGAMGNGKVFYVAEEPMALQSVNTGAPMAQTKSYRVIGKDIAAIGAFCMQVPPLPAVKS
jgi:pilus assembly protein CpaE